MCLPCSYEGMCCDLAADWLDLCADNGKTRHLYNMHLSVLVCVPHTYSHHDDLVGDTRHQILWNDIILWEKLHR